MPSPGRHGILCVPSADGGKPGPPRGRGVRKRDEACAEKGSDTMTNRVFLPLCVLGLAAMAENSVPARTVLFQPETPGAPLALPAGGHVDAVLPPCGAGKLISGMPCSAQYRIFSTAGS